MISNNNNSYTHQQCSQNRCRFSQTALQSLEVLSGLLPAFPGIPKLVISVPRSAEACCRDSLFSRRMLPAFPVVPRLLTCIPRCSPSCHLTSYVLSDWSPALPGVSEGCCIRPVNLDVAPLWHSGPITSKYSVRLAISEIHCTVIPTRVCKELRWWQLRPHNLHHQWIGVVNIFCYLSGRWEG